MQKKIAIPLVLGLTLIATNSAFAQITSYSSSVDISTADSSYATLPFTSKTKVSTNTAGTFSLLNYNGRAIGKERQGTTKASGEEEVYTGGLTRTYEVAGQHYEYDRNGKIKEYQQSSDTVTYRPNDWALSASEEELNAQEIISNTFNAVAKETDIDLTGYTEVTKTDVFKLDKDLFTKVDDVTRDIEDGDYLPVIYLHESKENLYVLQKKQSGKSIATKFSFIDGVWEKDTKVKSGEPLKALFEEESN
ncbi:MULTISPECIES: hypothetical protein [unclassified Brevibacillus]|uniref:hypothetical protein n=1 Tax=unclassified Brevibacillus TaxID=2684853 RepID=UPI003565DC2F